MLFVLILVLLSSKYDGGIITHFRSGMKPSDSFGIGTAKSSFFKSIDVFIIDEVSMLTPWVVIDISETLNIFNNKGPNFDDAKIIFVSELFQLKQK